MITTTELARHIPDHPSVNKELDFALMTAMMCSGSEIQAARYVFEAVERETCHLWLKVIKGNPWR